MEYLDFDLEIQRLAGGQYRVAVVRSPAGEAEAIVRFPYDDIALENRLDKVEIALLKSSGTRRGVPTEEEKAVQEFGQALYETLFSGEIRARYDVSCERAAQNDQGVRLRLCIQAPELAALPWEFLFNARDGEFVCLSSRTPVVRYIELQEPVRSLKVTPPLRILGMVASPSDLAPLDVMREKERLERATAGLRDRGAVELTWLEGCTWRDLQRAMRGGPWHIFHFVGHGAYDNAGDEGVVVLCDEAGFSDQLPASRLARLLADQQNLRLVLINACEGAKAGKRSIFSSVASVLVRRGIPSVIAMQYEITDAAAIEFGRAFYEALADGWPVDAAATEARKAVSLELGNSVEWGTPVVYMRTPDGVLFDLAALPRQPAAVPARAEYIPIAAPSDVEQETRNEESPPAAQTMVTPVIAARPVTALLPAASVPAARVRAAPLAVAPANQEVARRSVDAVLRFVPFAAALGVVLLALVVYLVIKNAQSPSAAPPAPPSPTSSATLQAPVVVPATMIAPVVASVTPTLIKAPADTPTLQSLPAAAPTETSQPKGRVSGGHFVLPPNLDGETREWSGLEPISLDATLAEGCGGPQSDPAPADASLDLKAGWDRNNLYFQVLVRDDRLVTNESARPWEDDTVELGCQANGHTWQFSFTADGRRGKLLDGVSQESVQTIAATKPTADGWQIEIAVPAKEFGVAELAEAACYPFTFGYWDDDNGGSGDSHLVRWGSGTNSLPAQWGNLELAGTVVNPGYPTPTPYPTVQTSLSSRHFSLPPVLDGSLGDWSKAPPVLLDDQRAEGHGGGDPQPSPADLSVTLHSGWDDGRLYFGVAVQDDWLLADSENLWEDDTLELGLEIGGRVRQYTFASNGRVSELIDGWQRVTPSLTSTVSRTATGWIVEVSLPSSELGAALTEGTAFPFTLGYWDDDDGGPGDSHLVLWGTSTNSKPETWRSLQLEGTPAQ